MTDEEAASTAFKSWVGEGRTAHMGEAFTSGFRAGLAHRDRDWAEEDMPTPEDDSIRATHPTKTGRHDLYAEAMRLVGARRSKGALVALTNWLLFRLAHRQEIINKMEARVKRLERELQRYKAKGDDPSGRW